MNYRFKNITISLLALCCSLVAGVALIFCGSYFALIFIVASLFLFNRVLFINRRDHEKIDFMFNALESDDYSFCFSEEKKDVQDAIFNSLLNRIKSLLVNAKQRTIEQEKYYEYIFDRLNTGVVIINDRGNILQANQAMHELLGIEILAHTNHIAKISEALSEAILRSSDGEALEVKVGSESGEKSFSVVASIIELGDESLKIVAVSSLDSALERKEVEAWSKLTRVLTHEIMNSLSPITSLSQTLLTMNCDPEVQQGLETIVQTNNSLVSFVENYRSFTTIQKPVKHPFEIKPLLENLLRLLCPDDVRTTLSLDPDDTMIFADENQVLQVMVNLLKNSVQAVEENTEKIISVRVYVREDENIVIDVSNNGPQIPPEVVENLFLPFFTTRKGGKGIGLSVSKRIMQLHAGSLNLTSNQADRVTFSAIFK